MTKSLGGSHGVEGWKSVALIVSCVSVPLLTTFVVSRRYRKWALDGVQLPQSESSRKSGALRNGLDLKQDDVPAVESTPKTMGVDFDTDDIIVEQFTRNIQFYRKEGQKKVHEALVVVIGLGGVGSHAATMLLRAGIGRLRLVDFDQVSLSSLNRHAVATRADVGTSKAMCLQNHFKRIFPECEVDARVQMFDSSSSEEILSGSPDFVLDCIDNIDTKVALLAACVEKGIKVLSATGAGARADPTRVRIADLSESSTDPLSRSVRHRLRRKHGIMGGIPVVFSTERPKTKLLPFSGPDGGTASSPADFQVVPGFRVRTIPVLGTIPAIFGQVMASYVITSIAGLLVSTEPVVNLDLEHYGMLHQRLIEREELLFGTSSEVEVGKVEVAYIAREVWRSRIARQQSSQDVDKEEVAYIVREVWRGRSARQQSSQEVGRGMWHSMKTLTLTRWDQSQPPSIANLVLLTFTEAEEHEDQTLLDLRAQEPEYYAMVESRLRLVQQQFGVLV